MSTPVVKHFLPGGVTGDKAKAIVYLLIGVVVVVILVVMFKKIFGSWDVLLQKFGLQETAEEKAAKQKIADALNASSSPTSPWSPAFYKAAPSGAALVTMDAAKAIAKQIWNSVGITYDDPEAGLAAIKQCPSKAAVSWVCDVFNTQYGRDMFDWLRMKYDTSNQRTVMGEIIDYVNNLKSY